MTRSIRHEVFQPRRPRSALPGTGRRPPGLRPEDLRVRHPWRPGRHLQPDEGLPTGCQQFRRQPRTQALHRRENRRRRLQGRAMRWRDDHGLARPSVQRFYRQPGSTGRPAQLPGPGNGDHHPELAPGQQVHDQRPLRSGRHRAHGRGLPVRQRPHHRQHQQTVGQEVRDHGLRQCTGEDGATHRRPASRLRCHQLRRQIQ